MTDDAPSLRDLFPWHFRPTGDQLKQYLTGGLVVFDTNALFDAYRLNPTGRAEFLHTLGLLGDRLWVPHRVMDEFLRNRLTVITECSGAIAELKKDLTGLFNKAKGEIEDFGGRRGLGKERATELTDILAQAKQQIIDKAAEFYRFELKPADCRDNDPILTEVDTLLRGRVGPPLPDMQAVREDAAYRFKRCIPPGYADTADKDPEEAIGDYVLWVQLLEETARRKVPVLFVTNERKEDWVAKQQGGASPLPRPELAAEVWERAHQPFQLVNVRSFLKLANAHLDAGVSEETIEQASDIDVLGPLSESEISPIERVLLAQLDQGRLNAELLKFARNITLAGNQVAHIREGFEQSRLPETLTALSALLQMDAPLTRGDQPDANDSEEDEGQ
ncbi:PIN-like domain-containing protein [Actinomadura sp. 3N508]|uniref:PIN-like domain-containing protein n=1 Tax=Actinomadura sp. 3N508 TaxID=3375153 RepID=UPI0037880E78